MMSEPQKLSVEDWTKIADRAALDVIYFGYFISQYAQVNAITKGELAQELGCEFIDLCGLYVCFAPRINDEVKYQDDLQDISQSLGIDIAKLDALCEKVFNRKFEWIVERKDIHITTVKVEAPSAEEANRLALEGEGEVVSSIFDYTLTDDDALSTPTLTLSPSRAPTFEPSDMYVSQALHPENIQAQDTIYSRVMIKLMACCQDISSDALKHGADDPGVISTVMAQICPLMRSSEEFEAFVYAYLRRQIKETLNRHIYNQCDDPESDTEEDS